MSLATSIAENVLRNLQRNRPPVHRYREVDGDEFRHVSRGFYRRTTETLELLGFSRLGDVEDLVLKEVASPDPRTFIRTMADPGRTTIAAFYHIAPRLHWRIAIMLMRIPTRIVEFESETTEGVHQMTTNAPASTQEPRPDTIRADYAPRSLDIAELYARHLENLRPLGGTLRRFNSVDAVIEAQVSQQARIREHLESIGWVTRDYLRSQGVRASEVDAVYDEVQRLLREGFGGPSRAWPPDQG